MITLGDVAIIGGGCYGSFYTAQLERARSHGAISYHQLLIVDHHADCAVARMAVDADRRVVVSDWSVFLDEWLVPSARDAGRRADYIVPSPLMPHLLAEWITRSAITKFPARDIAMQRVDRPFHTPFDRLGRDGVRYVSFADWICPTHCIEPLRCPAIRAPRTWEMRDTVEAWSAHPDVHRETAIFACQHMAFGVGMYPVAAAFDAMRSVDALAADPRGGELVIGSISHCHGAVAVLRVGAVQTRTEKREPRTEN